MDAFLTAALAPKPKAKRKAASVAEAKDSSSSGSQKSSADDAKRPRPRGDSLMKVAKTAATKTLAERTKTATVGADGKDMPNTAPQAPAPQAPPMLSFLATMSGQGVATGPSRTRLLIDKAVQVQTKNRLEDAHSLLTRALVACVCHAQLRSQFKEAGVPLDAFNPIGQCSCRDFVAAAQTRRSQTMFGGFAPPAAAAAASRNDVPFPITELDLTAVYDLATNGTACTCGSGRIRCTEPDHLAALDRLAAIASKLGRYEEANRIGQWYINLAPQHAEGYLHVAKAVLSATTKAAEQKKEKQSKAKDRILKDAKKESESSRFAARCLYTHGLHNIRTYGDATSGLVKVLERCCRQYSHDDYLPELPVETVEAIFQHLSLSDVLACRRVSKRWGLVLRRVRLQLERIVFAGRKEPSVKGLQRLLRQMPGLQTNDLCIRYTKSVDALKSAQFVTVALNHFQNAERLDLWIWSYGPISADPLAPTPNLTANATVTTATVTTTIDASLGPPPLPPLPAVSKCRHLVLHGVGQYQRSPARCLLMWASQSMESLELEGRFEVDDFRAPLPRLRHVKFLGGVWSDNGEQGCRFLTNICISTTQLEQLYLDNIAFHTTHRDEDGLVAELGEAFRHLHTLIIGKRCQIRRSSRDEPDFPSTLILFPRLPPGMRCLEILCGMENLAHKIMFGSSYDPGNPAPLPVADLRPLEHLEAFRCLSPVDVTEHIFQLIEPSLCRPTGRLAHLELNARDLSTAFLRGELPRMRIPHPERLRTVGLYDFNWSSSGMGSLEVVRDRVFLDWVAQFRNAETISVYPAWRHLAWANDGGECGRLVVALVDQVVRQAKADAAESEEGNIEQHLKLRTIYQGMLHGAMRQHAMELIGDHPIQIPQDHYDLRPPVFPWPDRDE